MKMLLRSIAIFSCLFFSFSALAGGPPPPSPTYTDTKISDDEAFVGLNWKFGGSLTPELEFGFRDVDVKTNGDVSGAGISISFDLLKMAFDKIKLKGIAGDKDLQGELGGGFSLLNSEWLGTLGAQGSNFNLGLDLLQQQGLQLNGGINTVDDYDAPAQQGACPSGFTFSGGACVL